MKKFNKNSLLFIFFIFFIIIGFSFHHLRPILGNVKNVLVGHTTIEDAKNNIDTVISKELTYHGFLMDCNSIKENLLGTRIVKKDDTTIVKSDSGSLVDQIRQLDKNEIQNVVKKIDDLKSVSENNGANFLYCAAPGKELYQNVPQNVDNYFKNNYDLFLSELANSNIPTINFADSLNKNKVDFYTFYYTDHHWTTKSGFTANNALIKELNLRYDFEYDKEMIDLSNYNIDNWL